MKTGAIVLLSLLTATSALAQQSPVPNPQEQIERTIGGLFVANTNLTSQVQALQAQLAEMQKRIKELEPKPEKKE